LKRDQRTLSALFHAAERAELTRRLGVEWGPVVNGIAEIAGFDRRVLEEFSTRTKAVGERLSLKLDRFEATMGREATPRERWQLEREAAVDSRPAKDHAVNAETLHDRWLGQLRTLGVDPERLVASVIGRSLGAKSTLEALDRDELIDGAIGALADQQSSWRPAEIVREMAAVVPTTLVASAEEVVGWVDEATQRDAVFRGIELGPPPPSWVEVRDSDGRPITEGALDRAITQWWILEEEAFVLDWAARGVDPTQYRSNHATLDRCPDEASSAQREAAAVIAGAAPVVLVVGPAGTGKTTAMRPAVEQLQAEGRVVFGVAPSAIAASVLSAETGVAADTIDKLLAEHRTGCPKPAFDPPRGTTVIVDEAGMLGTAKLAELIRLAEDRSWRVALVGDPLQFSSVGRGGMFGMLVDIHGGIELDRVHRFTNGWERSASLRLRCGDPAVAETYEAHGRLHGGTVEQMEHAAVSAWWKHWRAGEPVLLMAPSYDTISRLNERAQHRRMIAGELDPSRFVELVDGLGLHVGDVIATRRNDRSIKTSQHEMIRNRNTFTVTAIHHDGSVAAAGPAGRVILPADYVADHVELAYAVTAMGAQGRTVDHAITVIDSVTDIRNLYVPMTRGRESNHAYLAIENDETVADVFARYLTNDWIDLPAHQRAEQLWAPTGCEPDWRARAVSRNDDFGMDL
jgi:hypothetical protein